jgi:hypothetical protein
MKRREFHYWMTTNRGGTRLKQDVRIKQLQLRKVNDNQKRSADDAAGVAHEGGEFGDEGMQTVRGRATLRSSGSGLFRARPLSAWPVPPDRGLPWRPDLHRRTAAPPSFDQMPFDVVSEHAQEDVRTDAALEPVMDRTDLQIYAGSGSDSLLLADQGIESYCPETCASRTHESWINSKRILT